MPTPQIPGIWLETCEWYYLYEIGFLIVAGRSSVWLDSNENWTCGRFKLCLAIKLDPTVCSSSPVVIRVNARHFSCQHAIDYGYLHHSIIKHNPWRMTVNADEDDYRTGCWNVSHCQQQQSYSGLRSPERSNSTFWTYFCCFSLALANILPWPLVPFFQISLKSSEFKTTHNTFRDCRVHFFDNLSRKRRF